MNDALPAIPRNEEVARLFPSAAMMPCMSCGGDRRHSPRPGCLHLTNHWKESQA